MNDLTRPLMYVDVTQLSPLGPPGATGPAGPQGPPGATGPAGPASMPDAPANGVHYGRFNTSWSAVLAITGGTLVGPLYLQAANPVANNEAVSKLWVENLLKAHDAPAVGVHLARVDNTWSEVLPVGGGNMTGPIALDPAQRIDGGSFT